MTNIASQDTFIKQNIENRINAIIASGSSDSKNYIITEALKNIESDVSESFINTYCGDNPSNQIEISYSFPQNRENLDALVIVNAGAMTEDDKSLGDNYGSYTSRGTGLSTETAEVQYDIDNDIYFIETLEPVSEFVKCDAFSQGIVLTDEKYLYQNRLFLSSGAKPALGVDVTFSYIPLIDGEDSQNMAGYNIGFNATETTTISIVSNHIDTLRCLSAIVAFSLISLRATNEQDDIFAIQTIGKKGLSTIQDTFGIKSADEKPLYAIQYSLNTKSTYSISYNDVNAIRELDVNLSSHK